MKRIPAILAIVALLGVSGCAANSFFCKNKSTILNGLQLVIDQSNAVISAIQTTYPGVVPAVAQEILNKAQQAKDAAATAMAKICPDATDLTTAQQQITAANMQMSVMVSAGKMKLGR